MTGDTLSDLLRAVRLRGAIFFYVEGTAPWVAEAPEARTMIPTDPAGRRPPDGVPRLHARRMLGRHRRTGADPSRGGRHRHLPARRPPRHVERTRAAGRSRRHEGRLRPEPAPAAVLDGRGRARHDDGASRRRWHGGDDARLRLLGMRRAPLQSSARVSAPGAAPARRRATRALPGSAACCVRSSRSRTRDAPVARRCWNA